MVIGITGGVGCGKSTVLSLLMNEYNFYIIDADKVAHKLMTKGNETYRKIVEYFGSEILDEADEIDRKKLGNIVFSDKEKLNMLNGFVHGDVKEEVKCMIEDIKHSDSSANIALEAALLIEVGFVDICEEVWYIYTNEETRINRLMTSRGYTREKATDIINNQLSDEEFRNHCHKVIDNGNSFEDTKKAIEELIK